MLRPSTHASKRSASNDLVVKSQYDISKLHGLWCCGGRLFSGSTHGTNSAVQKAGRTINFPEARDDQIMDADQITGVCVNASKVQRVVVLGGGFAGAFTAKALSRFSSSPIEVELISDRNYFVFQPLLPEVAAGTINAADAVTPLRLMLKGVNVRMGEVRSVDFDNRVVEVVQGSKRVPINRSYDHLVLALGQRTSLERFPGFAEHSLCMRDLADAHRLRNHMIQCLEHADVTDNPELKRRLLTFVVVGGGFSGVEIIGELKEMLERTAHLYPNITPVEIRTLLVQRSARILPELPDKLGTYAAQRLSKWGIEILFETSLARATANAVFTDDGQRIDTATLITTIGNAPSALVERLDLELNRGKIVTDENLAVPGREGVWALGDAALVALPGHEGQLAPTTAQFAVREAKCVADNINALVNKKPVKPFAFRPRGTMASLGHYRAVAEVFGIRISGLVAWILWRGFYLSMLPGFTTKARVALNWLFDYFLPRSIVQIRTDTLSCARSFHYVKGDVLFERGQIVDGFYAVISGTLESRVPAHGPGEDFVRILGAGDHWGERSLAEGTKTKGQLTAVDDCEVLVLRRDEFTKLRQGLPAFDDYFRRIPQKIYPRALRSSK